MLSSIDETATSREIINFLRGATRAEISAVIVLLNRSLEEQISLYGSKIELLEELTDVPKEDLWAAVDCIFDDESGDEAEEADDDSEDIDGETDDDSDTEDEDD